MCRDTSNSNLQARPIFMAKMAFLVPVPIMLWQYRCRASNSLEKGVPFVHNLNASFTYCSYHSSGEPVPFRYTSRYNGADSRQRRVGITPYLLQYRIGKNRAVNYAVVLIATIDKHFHTGGPPTIQDDEWCTPFDLVYLKRAVYKSLSEKRKEKDGLFTSANNGEQNLRDWLTSIICQVSGVRARAVDLSGIISSTNITVPGIDATINDVDAVNKEARNQYYLPTYYSKIEDFLDADLVPGGMEHSVSDARRFIYGFLRNNDNFMQLHQNSVRPVLDRFYSNNYVEGYWAVEDGILSVKTGSPFVNLSEDEQLCDTLLSNSLDGNNCLMELCVLGMLDRELEQFSRHHNEMKPHEIELRRAQIAEYFNERILNVWELDRRMDYFMNRFRLDKRFRRVLEVAVPRVNARNVIFSRTVAVIGWVIALITLIVTIIIP